MRPEHRLRLALTLLLMMAAAIILLLPSSPLSVISQQDQGPVSGTVTQQASTPEPYGEVSGTPSGNATEDSLTPATTVKEEGPAATVPATSELDAGSGNATPSNQSSRSSGTTNLNELLEATENPDWRVRWDAVNALGNLKDPVGIPALVERALYDDNPHPRWRSLWALAAIDRKGAETIHLLIPALESADPVVVRNAAVALAFFHRSEAIPEILEGLRDPDEYRRWEAVFSLHNFSDPEVAKALILLLDEVVEPAERVRREAALALGHIGGEEVTSALLNALQNDDDPGVRWRAALALSRFGDTSLVSQLEQALSAEQDPQVREYIQDAIALVRER